MTEEDLLEEIRHFRQTTEWWSKVANENYFYGMLIGGIVGVFVGCLIGSVFL